MSNSENNANTLTTFRGFGILTFDDENEQAKIKIIRGEGHKFSVKVEEPQFDGSIKITTYRTDDLDENDIYLPVGNVSMEISATENPAVRSFEKLVGKGDFDRLNFDESRDFRWVVRMDELYGKEMSEKNTEDLYTTTELTIKNATFFAYELDDEWQFEKFVLDGKEVKNLTPFGRVAETIGAEIEADRILLKINSNGDEFTHEFSGKGGKITIENVDEDGNDISDLQFYEKCFDIGDANPVRLAGNNTGDEITPENAIDQSGGREFCHPVSGGS